MYDPSLLHYWTETRPRGEWPTTTVSPACTPSITRTVHTSIPDEGERPVDGVECEDCAAVVTAITARLNRVHLHTPTGRTYCGAPAPADRVNGWTAYRSEATCPGCLATLGGA